MAGVSKPGQSTPPLSGVLGVRHQVGYRLSGTPFLYSPENWAGWSV